MARVTRQPGPPERPPTRTPVNDLVARRCDACPHAVDDHRSGPTARRGCNHCGCRRWWRIVRDADDRPSLGAGTINDATARRAS